MGNWATKSPRSDGFSLAELVIVVAVIGIMAAVAMPTTSGVDQARVDEAAAEIAQAFRYARDRSITEQNSYGVSLDTAEERVRVARIDMAALPPAPVYDVRHPLTKKLWDIDFDEHRPTLGVDFETTPSYLGICVTPHALVRFASGEVVDCAIPANVRLDGSTVTLTRGDATATVVLDGLTGRVTTP